MSARSGVAPAPDGGRCRPPRSRPSDSLTRSRHGISWTVTAGARALCLNGSVEGATISVAAGGDLQSALNSAQPGDTVLLEPNAEFVGNFVLPGKSGDEYQRQARGRRGSPCRRLAGIAAGFRFTWQEDEMPGLTTLRGIKKVSMQGVFVAALIALIGFGATTVAARGQQLWSIVIHFQYQDGFEFDYVLQRGVSTAEIGAALAECGRSHRTGSVVRYHCYPVPE